jgi:hypothetical protein
MNDMKRDQAERLIAEFLDEHDKPTVGDWKRLADQYPEHAAAFVDAALVRAAGDASDASDEEYKFDARLATQTVSKALNKAHQMPSANLEAAAKKVAAIQGPTARKEVAVAVGIGPHAPLLNGVLVGRTKAPRKVVDALASLLGVSAMALRELFARAFAASSVPAFKAGDGKPQVASEPATWEEAVRGLGLPPDETARLLKLAGED